MKALRRVLLLGAGERISLVLTLEAVASFARLWVSDEHWQAAEKVVRRR